MRRPELVRIPSAESEQGRAPTRRTALPFGDRGQERPPVQGQRKREAAHEEQCDQKFADVARDRTRTVVGNGRGGGALNRRRHRDARAARIGPGHGVDDGCQRGRGNEQQQDRQSGPARIRGARRFRNAAIVTPQLLRECSRT